MSRHQLPPDRSRETTRAVAAALTTLVGTAGAIVVDGEVEWVEVVAVVVVVLAVYGVLYALREPSPVPPQNGG